MKDFKEAIAKPREVALYARMGEHTWISVFEVTYSQFDVRFQPLPEGQSRELTLDGYVRISDPVKMTFTSTDQDTMVRNAVETLNEEERKAVDELNKKIAAIREKKSQLLALTHQVEA